jgi:hypothetical protein
LASWNQFLEQLISQSEKKAQLIDSQMGHLGIYYRFSVPTGLERSRPKTKKGPEEIIAHTDVYLEDVAVSQKVDVCVDFLKIRDGIPSLEQLSKNGIPTLITFPLTVVRILWRGKDPSSSAPSSYEQLRDAARALGIH